MIEKDSISYKKSLIKSIINDLREIISLYGSKYTKKKKRIKRLRSRLRLDKKAANDEKEDDNEYLQGIIDALTDLKGHYLKETKHYNHGNKYMGIESIRYLFDEDEDYYKPKLFSTAFENNYLQYQTFSSREKMLSPVKYIEEIKPKLIKLINKHKNDNWKIQLTMKITFIPVGNYNGKRSLYFKTKNVEIMMGSDTDQTVKELFESIMQKYKELIEHSTKISGLVLQDIELMEYDINKITINRVGSYIESPEWLKSKNCTINPQNKNNNKCFQYPTTFALNHEKIINYPEKISKIRPFIDEYNWTEIDFSSNQKDWKKSECNNKLIALNILYTPHNTKDVRHAYKSKFNLTRKCQIILLIITDDDEN